MGSRRIAASLAAALACLGCGGGGSTDAVLCRDAEGAVAGEYRAYDKLCLYQSGGVLWQVERATGALVPVWNEDLLGLVYTQNGCQGPVYVRCLEAPCTSETFMTWDGKIRASPGASMETRSIASGYLPTGEPGVVVVNDECQEYKVAMQFLTVPLDYAPEVTPPQVSFKAPVTAPE